MGPAVGGWVTYKVVALIAIKVECRGRYARVLGKQPDRGRSTPCYSVLIASCLLQGWMPLQNNRERVSNAVRRRELPLLARAHVTSPADRRGSRRGEQRRFDSRSSTALACSISLILWGAHFNCSLAPRSRAGALTRLDLVEAHFLRYNLPFSLVVCLYARRKLGFTAAERPCHKPYQRLCGRRATDMLAFFLYIFTETSSPRYLRSVPCHDLWYVFMRLVGPWDRGEQNGIFTSYDYYIEQAFARLGLLHAPPPPRGTARNTLKATTGEHVLNFLFSYINIQHVSCPRRFRTEGRLVALQV